MQGWWVSGHACMQECMHSHMRVLRCLIMCVVCVRRCDLPHTPHTPHTFHTMHTTWTGPIFPNRGDQEKFWKMTRRFTEELGTAMGTATAGINAVRVCVCVCVHVRV